ncbi:lysozyme inhibitor LprI family protein, partial [Burkholderia cepacia]|uniref:lysozyme inhibitor LprI family protein n=1 Tax=Burkholderia cepacia TaxID=292 RepID=UPI0020C69ABB
RSPSVPPVISRLANASVYAFTIHCRPAMRRPNGKPANAPRDPAVRRVRPCEQDAACEHALFDLNRYYQKLRRKMPAHSAATLVRAQRAWVGFRDATAPLVGEDGRVDLIGARIATMKRLSETAGNK